MFGVFSSVGIFSFLFVILNVCNRLVRVKDDELIRYINKLWRLWVLLLISYCIY